MKKTTLAGVLGAPAVALAMMQLGIGGCDLPPIPWPSPSPTASPVATPTPEPTPTPVPTATPSPEPTPEPTPIPTPTPVVCPSPTTCPPAAKWGIGLHTCTGVKVGETCVLDSTPRFGTGNGRPCNEEHHEICTNECGSWRRCEPVSGPLWKIVKGQECVKGSALENEGYAFKLKEITCRVQVQACWPPWAKDKENVPLDLSAAYCGVVDVWPQ